MLLTWRERRYRKEHLRQVCHTTLDPMMPGVVRIHLVPPRATDSNQVPYLVILNGQDILPVTFSWAVLLSAFMDALAPSAGAEIPDGAYDALIAETVKRVQRVYPRTTDETLRGDLHRMLDAFIKISRGEKPDEDVGALSIFDYAPHMRAPHRMDLMLSAMTDENGAWRCNQRCVHCYAAGQKLSGVRELDTKDWEKIIDMCRAACVAQLTFTGGEPTLRPDLAELVGYARFFITRLNTNGVLLTQALCDSLYEASLDSVQVTLYSSDEAIHNRLVGARHFGDTVDGIRNAVAAGLNVSINTPLCALNGNYVETLRFAKELGVRYFTCSGLIHTGGACTDASEEMALDPGTLKEILRAAFDFCARNGLELNFTSPGCLTEAELREVGATQIPSCGAALSNMAVAPDGEVIPCQSWLKEGLGNLLRTPFDDIWNSRRCREIRERSARAEQVCQLKDNEALQGGNDQ